MWENFKKTVQRKGFFKWKICILHVLGYFQILLFETWNHQEKKEFLFLYLLMPLNTTAPFFIGKNLPGIKWFVHILQGVQLLLVMDLGLEVETQHLILVYLTSWLTGKVSWKINYPSCFGDVTLHSTWHEGVLCFQRSLGTIKPTPWFSSCCFQDPLKTRRKEQKKINFLKNAEFFCGKTLYFIILHIN